jgi:hypothetical protein
VHPVEHLDTRVLGDASERLTPTLIDHNGADRPVESATLWAILAPMLWRVNRANEVDVCVRVHRQYGCSLSFAQCVVGH